MFQEVVNTLFVRGTDFLVWIFQSHFLSTSRSPELNSTSSDDKDTLLSSLGSYITKIYVKKPLQTTLVSCYQWFNKWDAWPTDARKAHYFHGELHRTFNSDTMSDCFVSLSDDSNGWRRTSHVPGCVMRGCNNQVDFSALRSIPSSLKPVVAEVKTSQN